MNKKISIIIPFYFPEKNIYKSKKIFALLSFHKCLSAILKSKYKNFEVIAVSDGSNKKSIEIVRKFPYRLIKIKKNSGAGYARNIGSKVSKGKILVFLDSDVKIKTNTLSTINNFFNKNKNHDILQGIYSNKINYKSYTNQYLQSYYYYYLFVEGKKKITTTLVTNLIAIKNTIFRSLKGFDSKFSGASSEDQELGFRLIMKGYTIYIEPKLNVTHLVNFGIIDFIKKIIKIQTDEMKMHLRNKKTLIIKSTNVNYFSIIIGLILITLMMCAIFANLFFTIIYFSKIILILNLIFVVIYLKFYKFIFFSQGFLATIRSIFYTYLHRFIVVVAAIFGLFDFYICRNKY